MTTKFAVDPDRDSAELVKSLDRIHTQVAFYALVIVAVTIYCRYIKIVHIQIIIRMIGHNDIIF